MEEKGKKNVVKQLSGGLRRRKDSAALFPPHTAAWLALLADLFLLFSPNAEPDPRLTGGYLLGDSRLTVPQLSHAN